MPTSRVLLSPTGRRLVRRRSPIAGWGVYAGQRITKNSRIINYAGEKISADEADRRETNYQAGGRIWCFRINRRWLRDASVGGNWARFAFAHNRQSRAVDDEMDGASRWDAAEFNRARLTSSGERGVVGGFEIDTQQRQDRPQEAFRLAQGQPEDKAERQRRLDRTVRELLRRAWSTGRRRAPCAANADCDNPRARR